MGADGGGVGESSRSGWGVSVGVSGAWSIGVSATVESGTTTGNGGRKSGT